VKPVIQGSSNGDGTGHMMHRKGDDALNQNSRLTVRPEDVPGGTFDKLEFDKFQQEN
jgi:hypothetical protein